METIKQTIPTGHPNRPGGKLETPDGLPTGIVVHYTQNDNTWATDTANAKYFGRAWHVGTSDDPALKGKPCEWQTQMKLNEQGVKVPVQVEVAFSYGSAQIICDEDSVTEAIPVGDGKTTSPEPCWGCGDRRMPWEEVFRGQQHASKYIFNLRPNYKTVNVEICNNASWAKAVNNAIAWITDYLLQLGLKVNVAKSLDPQNPDLPLAKGEVVILRHFDVSGKMCPKPMIDDQTAWVVFVNKVAGGVNG